MIRRAEAKDLYRIRALLFEVHEVHASIRPDIFVKGQRKYSDQEILKILEDDDTPVYVYEDQEEGVLGYAFCQISYPVDSPSMKPRKMLYIDDLCVEKETRGKGIGKALYLYVKEEARRLSCQGVFLNVWEGNDKAKSFYKAMGLKPLKTYMEELV